MTREEAIRWTLLTQQYEPWQERVIEALDMAVEALKAQDRPIICPRCGRVFAESEGRE